MHRRRLELTLLTVSISCAVACASTQQPYRPPDLHDGLRTGSAAGAGLDTTLLAKLPAATTSSAFPKTTSILVARGGTLVYESYFGAGSRDLLNDTRSATKTVTALAVGAAIADGRIASVTAPIFPFFAIERPVPPSGPAGAITVEDLLTMSSALDCDDNVDASPGNEEKMYPQTRWLPWALSIPTKAAYQRDSAGRGPFAYCTAGVFLLGQVLARATGESVEQYTQRRLFAPLGVSQSQWPHSPAGEVMTGGGLRLRSRDLLKLLLLSSDSGRWQGHEVLPASWLQRMLSVQRHANPDQDYGYLVWRSDYRTQCGRSSGWYMGGNGGSAMLMVKDLDAVVVVTRTNYNTRGMHQQTKALLEDYVLAALPCATK